MEFGFRSSNSWKFSTASDVYSRPSSSWYRSSSPLEVRGVVEETTSFGPRYRLETVYHTEIGSNRLRITDVITNTDARPAPLMQLYHLNLGEPFF